MLSHPRWQVGTICRALDPGGSGGRGVQAALLLLVAYLNHWIILLIEQPGMNI